MPQFDGVVGQCAWRLAGVTWVAESDAAALNRVVTQDGVTRRWSTAPGGPLAAYGMIAMNDYVEAIQWCNFLWNFEQTNFLPINLGGWALNVPKRYSPWFARYCEGHHDGIHGVGFFSYGIAGFAVTGLDISAGDADHPGQVYVQISGSVISTGASSDQTVNDGSIGTDCIGGAGQSAYVIWSGYVAGPPCLAAAGSLPFTGAAPLVCQLDLSTVAFHAA
jgi:hypothetical protein